MEEPFVEPTTPEEETQEMSGFMNEVRAETVNFGPGIAGMASANQDMTFSKGAAGVIAVGRDAEISKGGAQVMAIGHDLELNTGGAQVMVAGHDIQVESGVAVTTISQNFTGNHSFVGVVLSPKVELGEGNRVLLNTPQALLFGAAAGLVIGLMRLIFGKR